MVGPPRGPLDRREENGGTARRAGAVARRPAGRLPADAARRLGDLRRRPRWQRRARLTRDIQHDVLPRFVGADTAPGVDRRAAASPVVALRSRRPATRTRLFHNNTVRTIAPEYQWVLSADGARAADRRRARRRHGLARARRLPRRSARRRSAKARSARAPAGQPGGGDGAARRRDEGVRADRRSVNAGRRQRVGRAHLRLREGALRLRLEAHHAAGQQAGGGVSVQHLRVVRLRAGVSVVRAAAARSAARPPTSSRRSAAP